MKIEELRRRFPKWKWVAQPKWTLGIGDASEYAWVKDTAGGVLVSRGEGLGVNQVGEWFEIEYWNGE